MGQNSPLRRAVKFPVLPAETTLIAQCCVCGLLRARKRLAAEPDRWITSRAYEQAYGLKPSRSRVTHTYCSGCYRDFMQRVRPERQSATSLVQQAAKFFNP